MKGKRIWLDTETTGFDPMKDQILELAAIAEEDGKEIERLEIKFKLKQNIFPSPQALLVNKINPYSKAWVNEALTENEAIEKLCFFLKRHEKDGVKPSLCAYNADFDKDMIAASMARNGKSFKDHFNRSSFDPLQTARILVQSGQIKTKIKTYPGGRTVPSSSLEDVAQALNVIYKGEAHRAMTDVEVLKEVSKVIFKMASQKDMDTIEIDQKTFQVGEVYKVISDSRSSGVKTRHILVLDNSVENERLIAIDEDDLKLKKKFDKTAVRKFNYGTLIGVLEKDNQVKTELIAILNTNEVKIKALIEEAKSQLSQDDSKDFRFDGDIKDFNLIKKVQSRMEKATNKDASFHSLLTELKTRLDEETSLQILYKANYLHCALGHESFLKENKQGIKLEVYKDGNFELRVGLHPLGHYAVGVTFDKAGKLNKELKDLKNKKDFSSFLRGKTLIDEKLEAFLKNLKAVEDFKDLKHPHVIEQNLKTALDALKVKEHSLEQKAAITGLLSQLKKAYPETFKNYKAPIDTSEINEEEFFKKKDSKKHDPGGGSNSGGNESPQIKESEINQKENKERVYFSVKDHLRPGDKLSKRPCALCGRPLSASLSIEASMGPTCRKNLNELESDLSALSQMREPYKTYQLTQSPRPGDLSAVTIKGTEKELLAEFVSVDSESSKLLDRKKLKTLIDAGVMPALAIYLSLLSLEHSDISGIARLKPLNSEV